MGRMFSRLTPRHLPQVRRFFLSPGLLTPSPSPSPSPCLLHPVSVSPRLFHPPSSHLLYPSPVSPLPLAVSPFPSLTLILSPSSSSLASIAHYDLARSVAPRASLDLPPSPSRVASPLVLFARRVFVFLAPHPVILQSLHHPRASRPRLRSCAGKLGKYYSTSYL